MDAIALLKNRKWGFWGVLTMSLIVFALNLKLGTHVVTAVLGLLGPALLFGLLQLGSPRGWSALR